MRRLLSILAALAAVALVAVAVAGWQANRYLDSPLPIPQAGYTFEIRPGTPFSAVVSQLADEGLVSRPGVFRGYARFRGLAGSIQAGEYQVSPGATPRSLLTQFTSGEVVLYSFTIVEGWNHWDLLRALQSHPQIDASMVEEDWAALLAELGAESAHPEGLFLPETYRFPRNTTDRSLLKQAYGLMQEALEQEWEQRAEDAPVQTPYEALILASIVEKETARADERARIAGVFARRLDKRMRLQTDPTVIYGIGPSFNGNITRKDLRTDTPYNTYTRGGLPPTPIAMPGRDAIRAALNPEPGTELFFVATGLPDGSHTFSTTKAEHDAAVAEYLQRLRERRKKGQ